MPKNIIICCDGTWNTPDQKDGGELAPTNVCRLYNILADKDTHGNDQHRYYHPGVGTDGGWIDKVVGGGTGRGLDQNIMSAYYELCRYYQPDDRIFLFGFSRGAYTVRSLAGFIACCGLLDLRRGGPDKAAWDDIEHLFQNGYRGKTAVKPDLQFTVNAGTAKVIHFLGVWDTVGALGIPDDMALLGLINNLHDYRFHDTELSGSVASARHAVALDEMRASFQPTLWTKKEGRDAVELWFPGVHSDIGGGYHECGLSDGALVWMIDEARKLGLVFHGDPVEKGEVVKDANGKVINELIEQAVKPDPLGRLHDSCDGVFSYLPTRPRSVPQIVPANEGVFHRSALERQVTPSIRQGRYRPQCELPAEFVDIYAQQPWNETGIWLEAGKTYSFKAEGEWLDASISCGPAGSADGKFNPAKAALMFGTALGKVEGWYQELTGNTNADFRLTRRHEDAPWSCLMGAIASGGAADAKGRPTPHEVFRIGTGCEHQAQTSGYFYAYANDAWGFYGNNRGHVRLKVTPLG